jgi:pilus assembly protein CpaC
MGAREQARYKHLMIPALGRRATRPQRRLVPALLALWPATAFAQSDGATIHLGVGQQKTLTLGNVQRVAIGDPEIADVKQVGGGNELLLTGVGEGRTSLLVWQRSDRRLSYAVVVRKQDPRELVSEIRALLGDREGIRVRVVGDRVYLDGETLTGDDQERVQQVVSSYPQVRSFVRPSSSAKRLAADSMNRAFQRAGLEGAQATVVGGTLLLEGQVESKEDLVKADLLTKALGEKAENLLSVRTRRMVLVEVEFVEAAIDQNKLVGVKPPLQLVSTPGSGAVYQVVRALPGDSSTQPVHAISGTLSASADFSIGARFDDGAQRILSQPRLLCASGEKAEFTAGGEIPVLIATQNQFAVEFKKFGVVLQVTPTADRGGNIAIEVYAGVSDVDRSLSVRANGFDVPGLRLREVRTSVTVKDGETIVLSGLFSYDEAKEVSKVPLLGSIPILGELFKSRQFIERKTQLAIYVTPRLVSADSDRVQDLIRDGRKTYQDAASRVTFSLFD